MPINILLNMPGKRLPVMGATQGCKSQAPVLPLQNQKAFQCHLMSAELLCGLQGSLNSSPNASFWHDLPHTTKWHTGLTGHWTQDGSVSPRFLLTLQGLAHLFFLMFVWLLR